MKILNRALAYSMAWLMAAQPILIQTAAAQAPAAAPAAVAAATNTNVRDMQPRELTGFLDDKSAERRAARAAERKAGIAEDGTPIAAGPLANLPIVDSALSTKSRSVEADERLRVILHLDFLPHEQVVADALANHKDEFEALEEDRKSLLAHEAATIDPKAKTDAENYNAMASVARSQRAAYDSLSERNEALSATIKSEVVGALRGLIDASQAPVVEALEQLGGDVEFTTIAGNMIIATVPAGNIERVGEIPGLLRVVEDSLMEGHLNVSDTSTMVDPADVSLTGLWDVGATGGIYDPAIIDSGVDQSHPAMINNTTPLRDNFCSWYLVAANGSANFDDQFTCDDLQGHGTHVAGIVGSYGSTGWSQHLGIAHGVEKMVNLKAGWLNSSNGRASMFWSDKYNLVDRALNNNNALAPVGEFVDDVDGFNLSYGGNTSLDDTDGGRFWDSVISTYNDTPVTISAGNSGPSNTLFSDPAVSYNAITVANFNDRGTTSRNDDIINAGSTVGPTANGRRKPDLAAPGTSISAPNDNWESASDFVSLTGTSMAAPMVLGVIMDLMDAGVFDELSLKALLINTAQKNLPGMNIEGDLDGWDPQIGWGAMNAHAAYFHRFDTRSMLLAPRDTDGEYRLFKGSMRDEGATGEGRDRATMVWNRHATYDAAATPSEFFTLTDMNLRLYRESDEALLDGEFGVIDNVHQVRVPAGTPDTDVIVKPYAWSASYSHGDATEQVALALEDGFVEVELPAAFQGIALWPTEVEPNEVFDVTFWIRNDSEIASHNNVFNLELPAGWTLLSGIDTQNVGSAAAGGITSQVTYTLRAGPNLGAANLVVKHSHTSYLEEYGDFNWNIGLDVAVDVTPPNPNPMAFSVAPYNLSTTSVDMTAAFATDIHGPIEYYHDYTSSPSGGFGGGDSGWQLSRDYTDTGLGVNDQYCYRVWARDNANSVNLTTPSGILCAYTTQNTPTSVSFGIATTTSIEAAPVGGLNNLTLDASGVRVQNNTAGTASPWQQSTASWISAGLTPARTYSFNAQARNGDGDQTPTSASFTRATLANPPAVDGLFPDGETSIKVSLNPNGNASEAEYRIENTTTGVDSGWISETSYLFEELECGSTFNFQAQARNPEGIDTIIVPLGQQSTNACTTDTDGDGVTDDSDNCTLVPNPSQLDTNGDGYGNICDADLNNDNATNAVDLGLFRLQFFAAGPNDADFNGDLVVNFVDLGILRTLFFAPPGPSGTAP